MIKRAIYTITTCLLLSYATFAGAGDLETCRAKLNKAQQLDLLYDMKIKGGSPYIVVGPTFYRIPIDAKQGFAETVNCFLMSGGSGGMRFDLHDYRTGKVVARFNGRSLEVL